MIAKIYSATLAGVEARLVEIEVDVAPGMPGITIVGLADTSIREARERVRSCVRNLEGYKFPIARVSVNLAPAALPKFGTQFDLPVCVGILSASGQVRLSGKCALIGELALDGSLRPVAGVLPMVSAFKNAGILDVFLPIGNADEAALVDGVNVYPVRCIEELLEYLKCGTEIARYDRFVSTEIQVSKAVNGVDFCEIVGQSRAKRALEIAAAGGHNIALVGPPGAGKTMLAEALPSILPKLNEQELLEVTRIYSSAGLLVSGGIAARRPFRNPHHTVTTQAFFGGGRYPVPGEVTLAHRGVLFMDEFPEFSRAVVEALRQPLEAGCVNIARMGFSYTFPSRFMLVAAYNPCPCGRSSLGRDSKSCSVSSCTCTPGQVVRYQQKFSAPILDRIDMCVAIPATAPSGFVAGPVEENSEDVLKRASAARCVQEIRCAAGGFCSKLNSELSRSEMGMLDEVHQGFTPSSRRLLVAAAERYRCTARGYLKAERVSRTIADLAGSSQVLDCHVAEAFQYRTPVAVGGII